MIIDTTLKPIIPSGVTGVQFTAVFLIVYAIILMVLRRVELLKGNKGAMLMMSLVIAYFTASSTFSVLLITKLFPNLGVVTIILISFIAVIGMVPTGKSKLTLSPLLIIFGILFVIISTWQGVAGSLNFDGLRIPSIDKNELYGLIFLGIFILIVLLMFSSGGGSKKDNAKKAAKFFKNLIGWEGDS